VARIVGILAEKRTAAVIPRVRSSPLTSLQVATHVVCAMRELRGADNDISVGKTVGTIDTSTADIRDSAHRSPDGERIRYFYA